MADNHDVIERYNSFHAAAYGQEGALDPRHCAPCQQGQGKSEHPCPGGSKP